jgi:hypothetical protein
MTELLAGLRALVYLYEEPTLRRRFRLPSVAYLRLVNRWIPTPPRGNHGQSEED